MLTRDWIFFLVVAMAIISVAMGAKGAQGKKKSKSKKEKKKEKKDKGFFKNLYKVKNPNVKEALKTLQIPEKELAIKLGGQGKECPVRKVYRKYLESKLERTEMYEDLKTQAAIEKAALDKYRLKSTHEGSLDRKKRDLTFTITERWEKGIIPYRFDVSTCTEDEMSQTEIAMAVYEHLTMVQFEYHDPPTSDVHQQYSLSHTGYVVFDCSTPSGGGCSSIIGRNPYVEVTIMKCCIKYGIDMCIHEIGHLVGMYDEIKNYRRENFMEVNMNNVISSGQSTLEKKPNSSSILSAIYDLNSLMHYTTKQFSRGLLDTFTLFDDWQKYLQLVPDNFFYMMAGIQKFYDPESNDCPNLPECKKPGYATRINRVCKCRCPSGLDPDTYCVELEKTVTDNPAVVWPQERFSLFKGEDGCPAGFSKGGATLPIFDVSAFWISKPYDLSPTNPFSTKCLEQPAFEMEFCVRTDGEASSATFPKGCYCILAKDCPQGFKSGTIHINERNGTEVVGEVPDGIVDGKLHTCCRVDGWPAIPVEFPTNDPFFLLPCSGMSQCQEIKGMSSSRQFFMYSGFGETTSEGTHPFFGQTGWVTEINLCYYRKIKYNDNNDGGKIITLTLESPLEVFTSPNYPQNYSTDQSATWSITTSVPGAKIKLTFSDFKVGGGTDTDTDGDYVEIQITKLGLPGQKFFGRNMANSLISDGGSMSLLLYSDHESASRGFNATVSLVTDMCYIGDGRDTYDGPVNFTRKHKTCKPWRKMVNCSTNPFKDEGYKASYNDNHCLMVGYGVRPWCYTEDDCSRDYCDVCFREDCIDEYSNCDKRRRKVQFCRKFGHECRKTCGFCDECYQTDPFNYKGEVYYTQNGYTCLIWTDVNGNNFGSPTDYPDETTGTLSRYCRGVNGSEPWCYTTDDVVETDSCDIPICNNDGTRSGECMVEDDDPSCPTRMTEYPDVCDTEPLKCSSTCGLCETQQPIYGSSIICQPPELNVNYKYTPEKETYSLGESVDVQCGGGRQTITCSFSGKWNPPLDETNCGACAIGGVVIGDSCFYVSDEMLSHADATEFCNDLGFDMLKIDSQQKMDTVQSLMADTTKDVLWTSLLSENGAFAWGDGSHLSYTNWKLTEPDFGKGCYSMYPDSDVSYYDGPFSKTISGLTCQRWDSQSPHSHSLTTYRMDSSIDAAGNLCRDPDNSGAPWCYTTDPDTRWEYCPIPVCEHNSHPRVGCRDLSIEPKAMQYNGSWSITKSGYECYPWNNTNPIDAYRWWDPTKFPEDTVEDAGNKCRLPDSDPVAWCYITEPYQGWEECGLPACTDWDCYRLSHEYTGQFSNGEAVCKHWKNTQYAALFQTSPSETVDEAQNYCRDPDLRGHLWCVTETDEELKCGIPICEDVDEFCVKVMPDGTWIDIPCQNQATAYAVCESQRSEITACNDLYPENCAEEVKANPSACADNINFRSMRCRRTCGQCSEADPTNPSTEKCTIENTQVSVGNTFTSASCPDGQILGGSGVRACLPGGEVTGQPAICKDVDTVDSWVNNLPVTQRERVGTEGHIYYGENDLMRITRAGKVAKFRYCSIINGVLQLVVLRKVDESHTRVIAQTTVYESGDEECPVLDVDPIDQADVLSGDFIGFMFLSALDPDDESLGGIPWTPCLSEVVPEAARWYRSNYKRSIDGNTKAITDEPEGFLVFEQRDCVIASLNALIVPLTPPE